MSDTKEINKEKNINLPKSKVPFIFPIGYERDINRIKGFTRIMTTHGVCTARGNTNYDAPSGQLAVYYFECKDNPKYSGWYDQRWLTGEFQSDKWPRIDSSIQITEVE